MFDNLFDQGFLKQNSHVSISMLWYIGILDHSEIC